MLKQADAALVIGDPALRISLKMDALSGKTPAGDQQCCQGDPDELPVPGFETLFVYDVAHLWREMTGKPCVLAIWVGRPDVFTPEVIADFEASKQLRARTRSRNFRGGICETRSTGARVRALHRREH